MFGDSDLGVFFDATGFGDATVQFGGTTVAGILDQPQTIRMADAGYGGFEAVLPELRIPYNAFNPMPKARDTIMVNGGTYTVNAPTTEGNGAILCYGLKGPQ